MNTKILLNVNYLLTSKNYKMGGVQNYRINKSIISKLKDYEITNRNISNFS